MAQDFKLHSAEGWLLGSEEEWGCRSGYHDSEIGNRDKLSQIQDEYSVNYKRAPRVLSTVVYVKFAAGQSIQSIHATSDLMPSLRPPLFISVPRLPKLFFKAVTFSTGSQKSLKQIEGDIRLKDDDLEQLRRRRKTEWKRKQGVSLRS